MLGKSVSHQPVFPSLCWFWRSPKCLFCRPSSIACPKHARDANMPPRSPGRAKPSPGPASQAIPAFPFPRAQCSTLPAHALRSRSSTELVAHHGFITGGTAGRGMMDDCSRELKAAPTNRRIDFAAGHASGIGGIGKLEGSRSLVHTYCGTEYRHLTDWMTWLGAPRHTSIAAAESELCLITRPAPFPALVLPPATDRPPLPSSVLLPSSRP